MLLLAILSKISVSVALVSNRQAFTHTQFSRLTLSSTSTKLLFTPQSSSYTLTSSTGRNHPTENAHHGKYSALCPSSSLSLSAQPPAPASISNDTNKAKTIVATVILILLDIQFRTIFRKYSIPFPSSLAGCGALFATMIGFSVVNKQLGEGMYQLLNPGATLLAKWLPVFFVPSLITLPLASGLGTVWEVRNLEESNVSF